MLVYDLSLFDYGEECEYLCVVRDSGCAVGLAAARGLGGGGRTCITA